MPVSAVVITKNEEQNIDRCLSSLKFCDEIIVVDSMSTDSTIEIASKHTDKIFQQEWLGYAQQKNYAVNLSSNNWILSIDADEEVSPELKEEILDLLKTVPECSAYTIPRKTLHSGQWIKHGGWYPNRLIRLFDRSNGSWQGGDVHEYWNSNGLIGDLNKDLVHHSFENIFDQVERNNRYSTLGAVVLKNGKKKFSIMKLIGKPIFKFIETYFIKLGFLDGYLGFIISVSAGYSVFLKWAKLWELNKNEKKA